MSTLPLPLVLDMAVDRSKRERAQGEGERERMGWREMPSVKKDARIGKNKIIVEQIFILIK